jgi:hypothetical protein
MNPFTFGNAIREPARFHGRSQETRQIVNRLLSSAHESTSVVGERRIGKTSLLNNLSDPRVASSLGLTSEKFCIVYLDFQGLTDITPQRFWQRVLGKMAQSICNEDLKEPLQALSKQTEFDLFDLEDAFERSQRAGLTHVLLMDEFEYVTQNPNFKSDFFGGLRALAIHHGVALVPATRRDLMDLCHSEEIKGSPFFNIFANVVLRPFTHAEVDELIADYTRDSEYPFTNTEKQLVLELGGGYPFFIQMAGYYLYEGKVQELESQALRQYVTSKFNQQADGHFNYLWSHCSESEKITLLILLTLNSHSSSKKSLPALENVTRVRPRASKDLASLTNRGIVDESDGLYELFSPSFAEWITRELQETPTAGAEPVKVEDWAKSKDADKLGDLKKVLPHVKPKYWEMVTEVAKDFSVELAAAGAFELIKAFIIH